MSEGKDLTAEQEATLEALIDECGLCAVLQSLASVCDQKAAHIHASYNDLGLARRWAEACGAIGLASVSPNIMRIGRP